MRKFAVLFADCPPLQFLIGNSYHCRIIVWRTQGCRSRSGHVRELFCNMYSHPEFFPYLFSIQDPLLKEERKSIIKLVRKFYYFVKMLIKNLLFVKTFEATLMLFNETLNNRIRSPGLTLALLSYRTY